MRGQGRVFRPKVNGRETAVWWLDYSVRGRRHRESAHTTSKRDALELLRQRIGDHKVGRLVGTPDRVRLGQLRELVERQYLLDGRRSLTRVKQCWDHVEEYFGADTRAIEISVAALDAYAEARLAAGAARSTVNQELAAVRRGFRLAVMKGLLATRPEIQLPSVNNQRRGFFSDGDFAALLVELPLYLQPVITFARLTGWRLHHEILPLMWEAVDWEGQVIRLAQGDTKGGEARAFPSGAAPELRNLLETQWGRRDGPFVFHREGRCIKSFRTAWRTACKRAGLPGRIPHDLRRTAARDYRRAGVSEAEIMQLCGWRTRSVFDRYNIIDEADRAQAVARRFSTNGKQEAKSETAPPVSKSVTSSAT